MSDAYDELVVDGWQIEGRKTRLTGGGYDWRSITLRGPQGEYFVVTLAYDFERREYVDNLSKVVPSIPSVVSIATCTMWSHLVVVDTKQNARRERAAEKKVAKVGAGWVYYGDDRHWVHYVTDASGKLIQDLPIGK